MKFISISFSIHLSPTVLIYYNGYKMQNHQLIYNNMNIQSSPPHYADG